MNKSAHEIASILSATPSLMHFWHLDSSAATLSKKYSFYHPHIFPNLHNHLV